MAATVFSVDAECIQLCPHNVVPLLERLRIANVVVVREFAVRSACTYTYSSDTVQAASFKPQGTSVMQYMLVRRKKRNKGENILGRAP